MTKHSRVSMAAAVAATAFLAGGDVAAQGPRTHGAVYVMTNAVGGNAVLVYDRLANGVLLPGGSYATGGLGSGDSLGNQSGLVLSGDDRFLYVVNAGSNEISAFEIRPDGLELIDRVFSGGARPISVTVSQRLLYVLHAGGQAGGADSIDGFTITPDGHLFPIPGSSRPLSGLSTRPAQIGFTPDGGVLVVTEKATNLIDTFVLDREGRATGPQVFASAGLTPFGFGFGKRGQLIVSEAGGGADGSTVSSYRVDDDGSLHLVSGAVPTTETAACWISVTNDGRFAYSTNGGSGTVSGFRVGFDGMLTLLDADGVTANTGAGSVPLDMDLSDNGRFLYTLNSGTGTIGAFRVNADGSLLAVPFAPGLPAGANGLAAR